MFRGETIRTGAPNSCDICGKKFKMKVMKSGAGYYVGTSCCDGPNTRESEYYANEVSINLDWGMDNIMWRE